MNASAVHELRRLWPTQSRAEFMRVVMIGGLPFVILALSPERVLLSIAIAVAYLVVALMIVRPAVADRPGLAYAFAAAAFTSATLIGSNTANPAQYAYAVAKVSYFVIVIIPFSLAVTLLVRRVSDVRPAVAIFLALGIALAIATVVLRTPTLFGPERYAWQGNLLAVAALLSFQYWVVRGYLMGTAVGVLAMTGLTIANSRQSAAAIAAGLPLAALYWGLAQGFAPAAARQVATARRWITPLIIGLAWLAVLMVWLFLLERRVQGLPVPDFVQDPTTCNCLMGRLMALLTTAGDRDRLLGAAWAMFLEHPVLGAGPGSFVGRVTTYSYPHNVPLEIAAEFGFVGVAILLLPLAVGTVRVAVAGVRTASSAAASLLAILVVFAVVSNLSGDLPSARAFWVFGLVALKLGFAGSAVGVGLRPRTTGRSP